MQVLLLENVECFGHAQLEFLTMNFVFKGLVICRIFDNMHCKVLVHNNLIIFYHKQNCMEIIYFALQMYYTGIRVKQ